MTTYTTPEQRWQAVAARVAEAADHFVYAVRTTGVYCRPGCRSRLPRRASWMPLFFTIIITI